MIKNMNNNLKIEIQKAMRACAMRWRRDSNSLSKNSDTNLLYWLTFPSGNAEYWLARAIYHKNQLIKYGN